MIPEIPLLDRTRPLSAACLHEAPVPRKYQKSKRRPSAASTILFAMPLEGGGYDTVEGADRSPAGQIETEKHLAGVERVREAA